MEPLNTEPTNPTPVVTTPDLPAPVTKFDYKTMLVRVVLLAVTGFLMAFSKEYSNSHDMNLALSDAIAGLIQGAIAGLGLDQLVFYYTKTTTQQNFSQMKALLNTQKEISQQHFDQMKALVVETKKSKK